LAPSRDFCFAFSTHQRPAVRPDSAPTRLQLSGNLHSQPKEMILASHLFLSLNLFVPREGSAMKDAYEVLRQKEADVVRIRREVESLRTVVPLLTEDQFSFVDPGAAADHPDRKPAQKVVLPEATGTESQPFVWPGSGFWSALKRRQ